MSDTCSARRGASLRAARIILALVFFTSTSLLFLDIHGVLLPWISEIGCHVQFLPSLIHGLRAMGMAATGFVIVAILTLVFGRIYCSALCPLGILMDFAGFLKRKTGWRPRYGYVRPHRVIRYSLLAMTIVCFAAGSMVMINLLDPFSNFGRMANALAKPLVILGNNGISRILELAGNYDIPPFPMKGISLGMALFALGFAAVILGLALTRGRLYCNMICPVGTLLGLAGKAAPVKVRVLAGDCTGCRRCERACKSGCISVKAGIIDHSRCVACFNCLEACPEGAVRYGLKCGFPGRTAVAGPARVSAGQSGPPVHATHTRRGFLAAVATALTLLPGTSRGKEDVRVTVPNKIAVPKPLHPILPPGSLNLDRFTATCSGCHACVAQCPSHVLQPAITQYGLTGLFIPFLDPGSGFCNLNCNTCGEVCPTRAITPFTLEEKKQIQTGVVKFIRDNCIVVLQQTDCGACSEHCPTKAVTMVAEGKVRVPQLDEKICLGCGACEHVCPAKPNKAIYVLPHTVHRRADLPSSNHKSVLHQAGGDFNF